MHAYERAQEHLRKARDLAERADRDGSGQYAAMIAAKASMHYLGFLAETEWSKDTASDVEGVPDR